MKFFIYSRKSVYTGKGESVENQVEMSKQYIFTKFPNTTDDEITVYEDEGFSAKNTDRPAFQRMLCDIKTKKPNFIVCYRLDRISRNVSDFATLIEDLKHKEISFVCIKEEFDTSTPMGKAMMYMASVFAQLERETIAERVRDNMLMLARTGRWLGGTTPTGYISEKTKEIVMDEKIKTSCQLKDNSEELKAVDFIFKTFLELRSISGVSKALMKENIKSRSGKYFSLLGIKEILQNPVYCIADKDVLDYFTDLNSDVCFEEKDCNGKFGLLSYNKRDYRKKKIPRHSKDKWIIAIGKHKGRMSGKIWVAVQNILENNKKTNISPSAMHNEYSLLSGIIRCKKCDNRMFAKQRNGKNANHELFDYICNNKLRGGTGICDCQNINGQQTDDMVYDYLMDYTNENSNIYKLLEKLKQNIQSQEQTNPLEEIETKIKNHNEEMDSLIDSIAKNKHGEKFIQRVDVKITELDKELSELIKERDKLKEKAILFNEKEVQLDMIVKALSSLKNNFNILSIYEKRILIKILVEKIVWDGRDLHIFLDGE